MRCPKCDEILVEYLDNDQELGLYCENCDLIVSPDDSVYRIQEYTEEDIEATMLYKNDIKLVELNGEEPCMANYVHRCLRCNEYGFEISSGEFECVSCGFKWEVQVIE